jgi:HK97 family phage prohead protease
MRKLLLAAVLFAALAGCGTKRWIVEGVAATTGPDRNRSQFAAEVLRWAALSPEDYPTVFYNHDYSQIIGKLLKVEFRDDMLFVEIEISKHRPDLWELIRSGCLSGISISGIVLDAEYIYFDAFEADGRLIRRMLLVEISIVAVPAQPRARILRWREE